MPGGQPADALLYDQNVLDWAFVGERVGDHDFVSRGFTKNMRVLSPYEKLQIVWNDTVAAGPPTTAGPPASAPSGVMVRSVPATLLGRDGVDTVVEQLEDDTVTKCIVGGVDDVGGDPDGRPVLTVAVGGFNHHPGYGAGPVTGSEYAHLVVYQVQVLQCRVT